MFGQHQLRPQHVYRNRRVYQTLSERIGVSARANTQAYLTLYAGVPSRLSIVKPQQRGPARSVNKSLLVVNQRNTRYSAIEVAVFYRVNIHHGLEAIYVGAGLYRYRAGLELEGVSVEDS